MNNRSQRVPIPAVGKYVWAILAAMLLMPLVWLIVARVAGFGLSARNDPLQFVTTVSALMGTVFVVGGLVLALSSLVALFDVERRLELRAEALLPAIEERADRQIQAHLNVLQARTESMSWQQSEALIREALELYPVVRGARRAAAIKLSETVLASFQWQHGYRSLDAVRHGRISPSEVPLVEAIKWLEEAVERGEDEEGDLKTRLTLMYGIGCRLDKTQECLQNALDQYPRWARILGTPGNIIALTHSCVSIEDLKSLGQMLNKSLPIPVDDVIASVEGLDVSDPPIFSLYPYFVDWWGIERVHQGSIMLHGADRSPCLVRIWRGQSETGLGAQVSIYVAGDRVRGYPKGPWESGPWPALDSLIRQVADEYVFVAGAATTISTDPEFYAVFSDIYDPSNVPPGGKLPFPEWKASSL